MRHSNRIVSRGIVRLAFAALTVTLAATIAVAKTAEQCQADYDAGTNRCYANPDTTHMDTPTDVRYCLQRAKNKFNNCMSNATMSTPSGLSFEPARPKFPKSIDLSKGILDNNLVLGTNGPSATGQLVPAPVAPSRIN